VSVNKGESVPPGGRAEIPESLIPAGSAKACPRVAGEAGQTPLAGRTILIARDPGRVASLRANLEGLGAHVIVAPVTSVAPGDVSALDAAVADLDSFAWVVVTSVNAVNEVRASAERVGVAIDQAGVRWAAVGPATRRALETLGVRVGVEPDDHSAAGLVAAFTDMASSPGGALVDRVDIITYENAGHAESSGSLVSASSISDGDRGTPKPARVLVPQGDLASGTLVDGLRGLGFDVHVVVAYRTVPCDLPAGVRDAWANGEIDAIVLTAGSAARQVAKQVGPRPDVAGIAIGEPTAAAARAVGLRVDAVANEATDDALIWAVVSVFSVDSANGTGWSHVCE